MKLGIIGVPNSGKTSLFNSLTRSGAKSGVSPFSTRTANIGSVTVPEPRLYKLAEIYKSAKVVHTNIEFMDIAGLVKGSAKGEGLGNSFLSAIRESDALVHVVRCFDDINVIHMDGSVDPVRDINTINFELIFADLEQLERRVQKTQKLARADKSLTAELTILGKLISVLESGKSARSLNLSKEETSLVSLLGLLSYKPVIYALNVNEASLKEGNAHSRAALSYLQNEKSDAFPICAKLEEALVHFSDAERAVMLADLGITETGLLQIISASYRTLGLMSFLTAGPKEARAWTIPLNTKAVTAAGKIHSDIERGFIRAETVNFKDLENHGTYQLAKEAGLVRLEGKEYILKDGDVVLFRFNV